MTESEVLEIINKICDRYAYKFKFGYFEPEDIRQEHKDKLAKLEEELEQFLAMQNQDSTTSFETFAGSGA